MSDQQSPEHAETGQPPAQRPRREVDTADPAQTTVAPTISGGAINDLSSVVLTKRKTCKHYLLYSNHKGWQSVAKANAGHNLTDPPSYGAKHFYNEDWAWLPYTWLCSYMSMRDYQAINVAYKKWRVKSITVSAHHFVPFVDSVKSVGGNTVPSMEFSPLSFFEAIVDLHHEMPYAEITADHLPNKKMDSPHAPRADSALKHIKFMDVNYPQAAKYELEQSTGYTLVHCEDGFSFSHEFHPVDSQWRHALWPNDISFQPHYQNYVNDSGYRASFTGPRHAVAGVLGQKNKVFTDAQYNVPGHNLMLDSWMPHYPHSPPPHIYLRVPKIERTTGSEVTYGFTFWCTYSIQIEGVPNSVIYHPIKFSNPDRDKLIPDDTKDEAYQASGSQCHNMIKICTPEFAKYRNKVTFETA